MSSTDYAFYLAVQTENATKYICFKSSNQQLGCSKGRTGWAGQLVPGDSVETVGEKAVTGQARFEEEVGK